jgi:hypothetical protein
MTTLKLPENPFVIDDNAWELTQRAVRLGLLKEGSERVDPRFAEWRGFSRFCEQQLKIVNMDGELVPLRLNWMQRRITAEEIRARRRGISPRFIILKYRKGGVTTLEQALGYWTIWKKPHQKCLTLAHRPGDTRIIFHMVELYWLHQPNDSRHQKSPARTTWIELPEWDGFYMSGTAGVTSIARGTTLQRVHLSEAAQYVDLNSLHPAVNESLGTDGAYIIESTAHGRSGRGEAFFRTWEAAKRGDNEFIPLFFAWHEDPHNRLPLREPDELDPLDDEEKQLRQRFKLNLEQLKWWRMKRRRLITDGRSADVIHQEHPSDDKTCFLYGGGGYYDRKLLAAAEARCEDPITVEDNGRLRVWEEAQENTPYVIGCDVSEGVGASDSTAVCFNAVTGRQAFAWNWNRMPPDEFGRLILGNRQTGLGWRWKNPSTNIPAFVIIERNNTGHAALTGLLKLAEYPHECVYHHEDPTKEAYQSEPSKLPGWPHNQVSHTHLSVEISKLLREGAPIILDVQTINSIREVTTGTTGPDFQGHDLAVGVGLASIGLPFIADKPTFLYIDGKVHKI